jgi:glycerol uptake facilitator-like aquaporin
MIAVGLWRRLLAEFLGSGLLAAVVVGSGIAAQNLSPGDVGLELLENAIATGAGLFVLIVTLGPVSGAHFNPVVSFVDAALGGLAWAEAAAYLVVQVLGCVGGAVLANAMFALPVVSMSTTARMSGPHFVSEVVATAGLVLVIFALARSHRGSLAAPAVGAYIAAAYFFTSSTSFANPAIAVGRAFSNTFAGIAPASLPGYVGAEVIGGVVALVVVRVLYPGFTPAEAREVVVPHDPGDDPATPEGGPR